MFIKMVMDVCIYVLSSLHHLISNKRIQITFCFKVEYERQQDSSNICWKMANICGVLSQYSAIILSLCLFPSSFPHLPQREGERERERQSLNIEKCSILDAHTMILLQRRLHSLEQMPTKSTK